MGDGSAVPGSPADEKIDRLLRLVEKLYRRSTVRGSDSELDPYDMSLIYEARGLVYGGG